MMELAKKEMFVVDVSNKSACMIIKKLCRRSFRSGAVFFVSPDEFEALKDGVIQIVYSHESDR